MHCMASVSADWVASNLALPRRLRRGRLLWIDGRSFCRILLVLIHESLMLCLQSKERSEPHLFWQHLHMGSHRSLSAGMLLYDRHIRLKPAFGSRAWPHHTASRCYSLHEGVPQKTSQRLLHFCAEMVQKHHQRDHEYPRGMDPRSMNLLP